MKRFICLALPALLVLAGCNRPDGGAPRTSSQSGQYGREAETRALAHAVRWHTEYRVIIHGNRTVVFE